jgi:hypothetical protein
MLKYYTSAKTVFPDDLRPKRQLLPVDAFKKFEDLPSNKNIVLTKEGLMIVKLPTDSIEVPKGSISPG